MGKTERPTKHRARWWARHGGLAILIATCGCHGPPDTRSPSRESPQRIYAQHCLGCHGASGEGQYGPNIQGLNRSIAQIVAVIANGRGKMPSFDGDLSEERMRQAAEYVKTFKYKP